MVSSLDLMRGYYQVPMSPESKSLTSFVTSSGQWQFRRMPFGLCNAPATFQRLMNAILAGFPVDRVMVYLDDVLVIGRTFDEHLETLDQVLECLKGHGLKVNPNKCQLFQHSVKFLGHIVSSDGLSPLPENTEAIINFSAPRSIKSVQRFLGMVNFYRRFIPNCSVIAIPITSLLSSKKIAWTDECQIAFEKLKSSLVNPPILGFPDFQSDEPLCLYTDASQFGAGAYLTQNQQGIDRVIAYLSTTFNQAEVQYSVLDKELAAIRWAVKRLKPFLWGRHFVIYSDHKPLSYLHGMRLLDGRLARTLEELGDYDFEVRYIPGQMNVIADALSRDTLSVPVTLSVPGDYLLDQMHEYPVQGGADTLFRCFALYWLGSEEEHSFVRTLLIDHILDNPKEYNLTLDSPLRKRLRLMRVSGTLPCFEVIQAFSHAIQAPVFVYESSLGLVKYVPKHLGCRNPCYIKSYDDVYFSFLLPVNVDYSFIEFIPESNSVPLLDHGNIEVAASEVLYSLIDDTIPDNDIVPDLMSFEEIIVPQFNYFEVRNSDQPQPPLPEVLVSSVPSSKVKKSVVISPELPQINYFNPYPSEKAEIELEEEPSQPWREVFNTDTLLDWQKKSKPLRELRRCVIARDRQKRGKYKCKHRDHHKRYRSHYASLRCNSSGLLVKELNLPHLSEPVYPYLVPFAAACNVVKSAHIRNAHVGRDKLLHLVSPYIFYPTLKFIVKEVTRTCDHCLRTKPYSIPHSPPVLRIQSQKPFEKVHVDVLQLPQSRFGYKYVLNAVDQYSKWLASQPLKDKTSKSVSNAFVKIITSLPSLPDTVISDNGGEFTGDPFVQALDQFNIKHIFITPYSPQSNGLVERVNRTLMGVLTGLCPSSQWCDSLNMAVLTYNNTYHKELKCTPSECLTGITSKLPVQPKKKPFWKGNHGKFKPYAEDSLVGYKRMTRSGVQQKLSHRYRGPYRVVTVNPNQKTYVIEENKDPSKQYRVHHNQLRPWYNAPAYLQQSSMFLSSSNDPPDVSDYNSSSSELVPGLEHFDFSSRNLPCRPNNQSSVMSAPEDVPGLNQLNFLPGFVPRTAVMPSRCPVVNSQPSSVSMPVSNTPAPIVSSGTPSPASLPPLPLSPILPLGSDGLSAPTLVPMNHVGSPSFVPGHGISTPVLSAPFAAMPIPPLSFPLTLDLGSDNFSYRDMTLSNGSLVDSSSLGSQFSGFIGDLFSESINLNNIGDVFSCFASGSSESSEFHGFGPGSFPDQASVMSREGEDVLNVSSNASMYSFAEQSVEAPAIGDAAVALRQMFPVPLLPVEPTYVSDSDLPSISSDRSDCDYLPDPAVMWRARSALVQDRPPSQRLTRNARARLYPDVPVDEALERYQS
ncbi:MAG: RNase H-like domain-containing protein [Cyanobacteria bacterium J06553_1]